MVRLRISISRFCRCMCNVHTFVLQRPHPAATELISAHDNGGKIRQFRSHATGRKLMADLVELTADT